MQAATAAGGPAGEAGADQGVTDESALKEPLLPVSHSASSRSGQQQGASSSQAPAGDSPGDAGDWEVSGAGCGVVQDPWQEAVEQLDATQGDVKVSHVRCVNTCLSSRFCSKASNNNKLVP